jgi:hypothetical protein
MALIVSPNSEGFFPMARLDNDFSVAVKFFIVSLSKYGCVGTPSPHPTVFSSSVRRMMTLSEIRLDLTDVLNGFSLAVLSRRTRASIIRDTSVFHS